MNIHPPINALATALTEVTDLEQSIIEVLTHILKNNSFSFNNKHYLQIHGTAMESPMEPTYAILKEAPEGLIPIEWIRFIDDILYLPSGHMDLTNYKHFYQTSTDLTLQSNLNTHSPHNQLISSTQPYTPTPLANWNQTYILSHYLTSTPNFISSTIM